MLFQAVESLKSYGVPYLHNFGIHCATHQIRVILISGVVITSLFYPALAIYSSSQPQILRDFSKRILNPLVDLDAIQWYRYKNDLRDIWTVHDALHIRNDAFARARCGRERSLRAERLFTRGATLEDAGALTQQTLLETLRLEQRVIQTLEAEHFPCVRGPGGDCFVVSPLSFWNRDEQTLLSDTNVSATLKEDSTVTVARIPIARDMLLAGRETKENSASHVQFSAFLAVTFFFLDDDCVDKSASKAWLDMLERVAPPTVSFLRERLDPTVTSLEYITAGSTGARFSVISVLLFMCYAAFALMFWTSMKRMSSVHSRVGLAFTGLVEIVVCVITSVSLCAIVGFKLTMLPWAVLLVVILFIGGENMFRLVDAVVKTDINLPVKERIAQGLSVAGMSNTLRVVTYNSFLGVVSVFAVGAIRQLCVFAIVVLVAHWFLVHTFFIAVLSIDLQRLELVELLRLGSSASPIPPQQPALRSSKSPSGQPLKHAILDLRNILGIRATKNVSLVLLLVITGTLYYSTYPSVDDGDLRSKSASVHVDAITGGPALQLWRTLNPAEDLFLHLRIASPTYVTFESTEQAVVREQESGRVPKSWWRKLLSMRTFWWVWKILVLPIGLTTSSLYGLLLYLLKDTSRLEMEREKKQDEGESNRHLNPVDASIAFATLPRAFETDVEHVAVSKDGDVVAAASAINEILVWRKDGFVKINPDAISLDNASTLAAGTSLSVTSLALDLNGTLCAVGLSNGAIAIWSIGSDVPSVQPQFYLLGPKKAVIELMFYSPGPSSQPPSPSSLHAASLLVVHDTDMVAKWCLLPEQSVRCIVPTNHARPLKSTIVKVMEDQAVVAFCLEGGTVELMDIDDEVTIVGPRCSFQAGNPKDPVAVINACLLKLDGMRRLIVGATTDNGVISLWDAFTCECIYILDDSYRGITQLHLTPIPSTVCSQGGGEHPVDSFSLSFSVFHMLYLWRVYLPSQEANRRCTCPANQPPTTLAGPSALDNPTTLGGRRSRSGSAAAVSSRSRTTSSFNLSGATAMGTMNVTSFPVSAHGFHSRRGSEKDSFSARRMSDHYLSLPLDEDAMDGEVGPQPAKMAEEELWRNVLVVPVLDAPFDRGSWGMLSNGSLIGLRKRRRPESIGTGMRHEMDLEERHTNDKEPLVRKGKCGLPPAVKERWEVWTLDMTTQSPRIASSSVASVRPKHDDVFNATNRGISTAPESLLDELATTENYPCLPFTRLGPLVVERGACVVGLGNTVGYLDCIDLVGHAPPLSIRRPPNGFTWTHDKKNL